MDVTWIISDLQKVTLLALLAAPEGLPALM